MNNQIAKARRTDWHIYYRSEVEDWCRDFELGEPKTCRRKSVFIDQDGGIWECFRMRCPACGEETFAILSSEAFEWEATCDHCCSGIEFEPAA